MAKLCACFIFFLLFSLILRPEIHAVEARLLFEDQLRKLSSQEEEPARSGPSPGAGHDFGPEEDSKRSTDLIVTGNSGPSPGVGHAFGRKDESKRADHLVVTGESVPSPGVGHRYDTKFASKKADHLVVTGNSGPSPGVGHRKDYGKGSLITGIKNSGPSPGEGHKKVPAHSIDETKS